MSAYSVSYRHKGVADIFFFFLCLAACIIVLIADLLFYSNVHIDLQLDLIVGFLITAVVTTTLYCLFLAIPAIYSCCCPNVEIEELEYILGGHIDREETVDKEDKPAVVEEGKKEGKVIKILRRDSKGKWTYEPEKGQADSQV